MTTAPAVCFSRRWLMNGPRYQVEVLDDSQRVIEVRGFPHREDAIQWARELGWQGSDDECPGGDGQ